MAKIFDIKLDTRFLLLVAGGVVIGRFLLPSLERALASTKTVNAPIAPSSFMGPGGVPPGGSGIGPAEPAGMDAQCAKQDLCANFEDGRWVCGGC